MMKLVGDSEEYGKVSVLLDDDGIDVDGDVPNEIVSQILSVDEYESVLRGYGGDDLYLDASDQYKFERLVDYMKVMGWDIETKKFDEKPDVIQQNISVKQTGESRGEWVPYEGPQGGTGFRNTATDEIHYGDEPPVSDESGSDGENDDAQTDSGSDVQQREELRSQYDDWADDFDSVEEYSKDVAGRLEENYGLTTKGFEDLYREQQAKSIGVAIDRFAQVDSERLEKVSEYMDASDRGNLIDEGIMVRESGLSSHHASWMGQHRTVEINAFDFTQDEDDDTHEYLVAREDSLLEDIVIHEFGHALHQMQHAESDDFSSRTEFREHIQEVDLPEEKLEEEISEYAPQTNFEAVAEMFLYQSLGNELSDELQDLYDELMGPEPIDLVSEQ